MKTIVLVCVLVPALTGISHAQDQSWRDSPLNWQNSPNNWKNSPLNWEKSPLNWKNSPLNWKNNPKNLQSTNGSNNGKGSKANLGVINPNGVASSLEKQGQRVDTSPSSQYREWNYIIPRR